VKKIVFAVLAVLTVCTFMRAAEMRLLVQQSVIQPGEKLVLEGWGDLGKSESAFPTVCAALASISACSASRCAVSAAFLAFLASLAEALVLPCDAVSAASAQ
jgi:hypothetical protein